MSKVLEFFGLASSANADWQEVVQNQTCPYLNKTCIKNRKSQPEVAIGTCSVTYSDFSQGIIICPHRLLERQQVLAFVTREFGVGDIRSVQHRLGSEQLHSGELGERGLIESRAPKRLAVGKRGIGRFERGQFQLRFLVTRARGALDLVESFFDDCEIAQRQLEFDDLLVARRVGRSHDVRDVGVFKTAHDMHDCVRLADVLQELVAQSFARGRARHEAGDINELHHRRHRALGLHDDGKLVQPIIGHFNHADIRLDGAERVVRGFGLGGGEGVEEGGFADVGEADDTEAEHGRGAE